MIAESRHAVGAELHHTSALGPSDFDVNLQNPWCYQPVAKHDYPKPETAGLEQQCLKPRAHQSQG